MAEGRKQEATVMCAAHQHHCLDGASKQEYHFYLFLKLSSIASNSKSMILNCLFTPLMLCCITSTYAAEGMRPTYSPPPPAVNSGSVIQIILSLLLVLAAIVLTVWLLKRMNMAQQGSGNLLKVLGGVSIGQRERVVLVEIENTWLVIGVGPGQLRTLHTLQKTDSALSELQSQESQQSGSKFSSLLTSIMHSRKNGNERK